jgi:hypothetical protein
VKKRAFGSGNNREMTCFVQYIARIQERSSVNDEGTVLYREPR